MSCFRRGKFATVCFILQAGLIVVFAFLAEYGPSAQPKSPTTTPVPKQYPMFQDIHVMIFIGFGFLMTFLKRYGYTAVSVNLLISSFCLQWAYILRGWLHTDTLGGQKFPVYLGEMISADFAAATVLISFGAVLGKTSPLQLLIMSLIEVALMQVNEYIGLDLLHAVDVGESMYIHAFGAYFGLAVARVLYTDDIEKSKKEGSVYHSDLFSMIGTLFLWVYWPSFNGGAAEGDEQHRAVINTYLSLAACTVTTFCYSSLCGKRGKMTMEHIQNSTLAGGVAVGTTANMPLQPWGALTMGALIGVISVLGFEFLSPFMSKKLKIHDTCGVHNLHGIPGVFAGCAGAVMAAMSSYDKWGESLYEIFPARVPSENTTELAEVLSKYNYLEAGEGRSGPQQAYYQLAALGVTLGMAIVGGVITGIILKIPCLDNPEGDMLFDDHDFWNVADDYPVEEKELDYRRTNTNGGHENQVDAKEGEDFTQL